MLWWRPIQVGLGAVCLAVTVRAHTWLDCLDTDMNKIYEHSTESVSQKGFCKGYIKNFVGRGGSDVDRASTVKVLMDDVAKGPEIECSKANADYSDWRHRLQVKAGEKFYFGYLDNGHTSKDQAGRGTYYGTYWTGEPESSLSKVSDLTPEKLVDGMFYDYDDGTCGEGKTANGEPTNRAGDGIPCIGEASLPKGTKPGIYNLVWFWKFYKEDNGKPSLITTQFGSFGGAAYLNCYQVEVVADDATTPAPAPLGPSARKSPPRAPRPPSKPSGVAPASAAPAPPAPASSAPGPSSAAPASSSPAPQATSAPESAVPVESPGTVTPTSEGRDDAPVEFVVVKKNKKKKTRKKDSKKLVEKILDELGDDESEEKVAKEEDEEVKEDKADKKKKKSSPKKKKKKKNNLRSDDQEENDDDDENEGEDEP